MLENFLVQFLEKRIHAFFGKWDVAKNFHIESVKQPRISLTNVPIPSSLFEKVQLPFVIEYSNISKILCRCGWGLFLGYKEDFPLIIEAEDVEIRLRFAYPSEWNPEVNRKRFQLKKFKRLKEWSTSTLNMPTDGSTKFSPSFLEHYVLKCLKLHIKNIHLRIFDPHFNSVPFAFDIYIADFLINSPKIGDSRLSDLERDGINYNLFLASWIRFLGMHIIYKEFSPDQYVNRRQQWIQQNVANEKLYRLWNIRRKCGRSAKRSQFRLSEDSQRRYIFTNMHRVHRLKQEALQRNKDPQQSLLCSKKRTNIETSSLPSQYISRTEIQTDCRDFKTEREKKLMNQETTKSLKLPFLSWNPFKLTKSFVSETPSDTQGTTKSDSRTNVEGSSFLSRLFRFGYARQEILMKNAISLNNKGTSNNSNESTKIDKNNNATQETAKDVHGSKLSPSLADDDSCSRESMELSSEWTIVSPIFCNSSEFEHKGHDWRSSLRKRVTRRANITRTRGIPSATKKVKRAKGWMKSKGSIPLLMPEKPSKASGKQRLSVLPKAERRLSGIKKIAHTKPTRLCRREAFHKSDLPDPQVSYPRGIQEKHMMERCHTFRKQFNVIPQSPSACPPQFSNSSDSLSDLNQENSKAISYDRNVSSIFQDDEITLHVYDQPITEEILKASNASQKQSLTYDTIGKDNIYDPNEQGFRITPSDGIELHLLIKKWSISALQRLDLSQTALKSTSLIFLPHYPCKDDSQNEARINDERSRDMWQNMNNVNMPLPISFTEAAFEALFNVIKFFELWFDYIKGATLPCKAVPTSAMIERYGELWKLSTETATLPKEQQRELEALEAALPLYCILTLRQRVYWITKNCRKLTNSAHRTSNKWALLLSKLHINPDISYTSKTTNNFSNEKKCFRCLLMSCSCTKTHPQDYDEQILGKDNTEKFTSASYSSHLRILQGNNFHWFGHDEFLEVICPNARFEIIAGVHPGTHIQGRKIGVMTRFSDSNVFSHVLRMVEEPSPNAMVRLGLGSSAVFCCSFRYIMERLNDHNKEIRILLDNILIVERPVELFLFRTESALNRKYPHNFEKQIALPRYLVYSLPVLSESNQMVFCTASRYNAVTDYLDTLWKKEGKDILTDNRLRLEDDDAWDSDHGFFRNTQYHLLRATNIGEAGEDLKTQKGKKPKIHFQSRMSVIIHESRTQGVKKTLVALPSCVVNGLRLLWFLQLFPPKFNVHRDLFESIDVPPRFEVLDAQNFARFSALSTRLLEVKFGQLYCVVPMTASNGYNIRKKSIPKKVQLNLKKEMDPNQKHISYEKSSLLYDKSQVTAHTFTAFVKDFSLIMTSSHFISIKIAEILVRGGNTSRNFKCSHGLSYADTKMAPIRLLLFPEFFLQVDEHEPCFQHFYPPPKLKIADLEKGDLLVHVRGLHLTRNIACRLPYYPPRKKRYSKTCSTIVPQLSCLNFAVHHISLGLCDAFILTMCWIQRFSEKKIDLGDIIYRFRMLASTRQLDHKTSLPELVPHFIWNPVFPIMHIEMEKYELFEALLKDNIVRHSYSVYEYLYGQAPLIIDFPKVTPSCTDKNPVHELGTLIKPSSKKGTKVKFFLNQINVFCFNKRYSEVLLQLFQMSGKFDKTAPREEEIYTTEFELNLTEMYIAHLSAISQQKFRSSVIVCRNVAHVFQCGNTQEKCQNPPNAPQDTKNVSNVDYVKGQEYCYSNYLCRDSNLPMMDGKTHPLQTQYSKYCSSSQNRTLKLRTEKSDCDLETTHKTKESLIPQDVYMKSEQVKREPHSRTSISSESENSVFTSNKQHRYTMETQLVHFVTGLSCEEVLNWVPDNPFLDHEVHHFFQKLMKKIYTRPTEQFQHSSKPENSQVSIIFSFCKENYTGNLGLRSIHLFISPQLVTDMRGLFQRYSKCIKTGKLYFKEPYVNFINGLKYPSRKLSQTVTRRTFPSTAPVRKMDCPSKGLDNNIAHRSSYIERNDLINDEHHIYKPNSRLILKEKGFTGAKCSSKKPQFHYSFFIGIENLNVYPLCTGIIASVNSQVAEVNIYSGQKGKSVFHAKNKEEFTPRNTGRFVLNATAATSFNDNPLNNVGNRATSRGKDSEYNPSSLASSRLNRRFGVPGALDARAVCKEVISLSQFQGLTRLLQDSSDSRLAVLDVDCIGLRLTSSLHLALDSIMLSSEKSNKNYMGIETALEKNISLIFKSDSNACTKCLRNGFRLALSIEGFELTLLRNGTWILNSIVLPEISLDVIISSAPSCNHKLYPVEALDFNNWDQSNVLEKKNYRAQFDSVTECKKKMATLCGNTLSSHTIKKQKAQSRYYVDLFSLTIRRAVIWTSSLWEDSQDPHVKPDNSTPKNSSSSFDGDSYSSKCFNAENPLSYALRWVNFDSSSNGFTPNQELSTVSFHQSFMHLNKRQEKRAVNTLRSILKKDTWMNSPYCSESLETVRTPYLINFIPHMSPFAANEASQHCLLPIFYYNDSIPLPEDSEEMPHLSFYFSHELAHSGEFSISLKVHPTICVLEPHTIRNVKDCMEYFTLWGKLTSEKLKLGESKITAKTCHQQNINILGNCIQFKKTDEKANELSNSKPLDKAMQVVKKLTNYLGPFVDFFQSCHPFTVYMDAYIANFQIMIGCADNIIEAKKFNVLKLFRQTSNNFPISAREHINANSKFLDSLKLIDPTVESLPAFVINTCFVSQVSTLGKEALLKIHHNLSFSSLVRHNIPNHFKEGKQFNMVTPQLFSFISISRKKSARSALTVSDFDVKHRVFAASFVIPFFCVTFILKRHSNSQIVHTKRDRDSSTYEQDFQPYDYRFLSRSARSSVEIKKRPFETIQIVVSQLDLGFLHERFSSSESLSLCIKDLTVFNNLGEHLFQNVTIIKKYFSKEHQPEHTAYYDMYRRYPMLNISCGSSSQNQYVVFILIKGDKVFVKTQLFNSRVQLDFVSFGLMYRALHLVFRLYNDFNMLKIDFPNLVFTGNESVTTASASGGLPSLAFGYPYTKHVGDKDDSNRIDIYIFSPLRMMNSRRKNKIFSSLCPSKNPRHFSDASYDIQKPLISSWIMPLSLRHPTSLPHLRKHLPLKNRRKYQDPHNYWPEDSLTGQYAHFKSIQSRKEGLGHKWNDCRPFINLLKHRAVSLRHKGTEKRQNSQNDPNESSNVWNKVSFDNHISGNSSAEGVPLHISVHNPRNNNFQGTKRPYDFSHGSLYSDYKPLNALNQASVTISKSIQEKLNCPSLLQQSSYDDDEDNESFPLSINEIFCSFCINSLEIWIPLESKLRLEQLETSLSMMSARNLDEGSVSLFNYRDNLEKKNLHVPYHVTGRLGYDNSRLFLKKVIPTKQLNNQPLAALKNKILTYSWTDHENDDIRDSEGHYVLGIISSFSGHFKKTLLEQSARLDVDQLNLMWGNPDKPLKTKKISRFCSENDFSTRKKKFPKLKYRTSKNIRDPHLKNCIQKNIFNAFSKENDALSTLEKHIKEDCSESSVHNIRVVSSQRVPPLTVQFHGVQIGQEDLNDFPLVLVGVEGSILSDLAGLKKNDCFFTLGKFTVVIRITNIIKTSRKSCIATVIVSDPQLSIPIEEFLHFQKFVGYLNYIVEGCRANLRASETCLSTYFMLFQLHHLLSYQLGIFPHQLLFNGIESSPATTETTSQSIESATDEIILYHHHHRHHSQASRGNSLCGSIILPMDHDSIKQTVLNIFNKLSILFPQTDIPLKPTQEKNFTHLLSALGKTSLQLQPFHPQDKTSFNNPQFRTENKDGECFYLPHDQAQNIDSIDRHLLQILFNICSVKRNPMLIHLQAELKNACITFHDSYAKLVKLVSRRSVAEIAIPLIEDRAIRCSTILEISGYNPVTTTLQRHHDSLCVSLTVKRQCAENSPGRVFPWLDIALHVDPLAIGISSGSLRVWTHLYGLLYRKKSRQTRSNKQIRVVTILNDTKTPLLLMQRKPLCNQTFIGSHGIKQPIFNHIILNELQCCNTLVGYPLWFALKNPDFNEKVVEDVQNPSKSKERVKNPRSKRRIAMVHPNKRAKVDYSLSFTHINLDTELDIRDIVEQFLRLGSEFPECKPFLRKYRNSLLYGRTRRVQTILQLLLESMPSCSQAVQRNTLLSSITYMINLFRKKNDWIFMGRLHQDYQTQRAYSTFNGPHFVVVEPSSNPTGSSEWILCIGTSVQIENVSLIPFKLFRERRFGRVRRIARRLQKDVGEIFNGVNVLDKEFLSDSVIIIAPQSRVSIPLSWYTSRTVPFIAPFLEETHLSMLDVLLDDKASKGRMLRPPKKINESPYGPESCYNPFKPFYSKDLGYTIDSENASLSSEQDYDSTTFIPPQPFSVLQTILEKLTSVESVGRKHFYKSCSTLQFRKNIAWEVIVECNDIHTTLPYNVSKRYLIRLIPYVRIQNVLPFSMTAVLYPSRNSPHFKRDKASTTLPCIDQSNATNVQDVMHIVQGRPILAFIPPHYTWLVPFNKQNINLKIIAHGSPIECFDYFYTLRENAKKNRKLESHLNQFLRINTSVTNTSQNNLVQIFRVNQAEILPAYASSITSLWLPLNETCTTRIQLNYRGPGFLEQDPTLAKFLDLFHKVHESPTPYPITSMYSNFYLTADLTRQLITFMCPFLVENVSRELPIVYQSKLIPPGCRLYVSEEQAKVVRISVLRRVQRHVLNEQNVVEISSLSNRIDLTTSTTSTRSPIFLKFQPQKRKALRLRIGNSRSRKKTYRDPSMKYSWNPLAQRQAKNKSHIRFNRRTFEKRLSIDCVPMDFESQEQNVPKKGEPVLISSAHESMNDPVSLISSRSWNWTLWKKFKSFVPYFVYGKKNSANEKQISQANSKCSTVNATEAEDKNGFDCYVGTPKAPRLDTWEIPIESSHRCMNNEILKSNRYYSLKRLLNVFPLMYFNKLMNCRFIFRQLGQVTNSQENEKEQGFWEDDLSLSSQHPREEDFIGDDIRSEEGNQSRKLLYSTSFKPVSDSFSVPIGFNHTFQENSNNTNRHNGCRQKNFQSRKYITKGNLGLLHKADALTIYKDVEKKPRPLRSRASWDKLRRIKKTRTSIFKRQLQHMVSHEQDKLQNIWPMHSGNIRETLQKQNTALHFSKTLGRLISRTSCEKHSRCHDDLPLRTPWCQSSMMSQKTSAKRRRENHKNSSITTLPETIALCVSIRYAVQPYHTSKIIAFGPRYFFFSQLPFKIHVKDFKASHLSNRLALPNRDSVFVTNSLMLSVGQCLPFHTQENYCYLEVIQQSVLYRSPPFLISLANVPFMFQVPLTVHNQQDISPKYVIQINAVSGTYNNKFSNSSIPYVSNTIFFILSLCDYFEYRIRNLTPYVLQLKWDKPKFLLANDFPMPNTEPIAQPTANIPTTSPCSLARCDSSKASLGEKEKSMLINLCNPPKYKDLHRLLNTERKQRSSLTFTCDPFLFVAFCRIHPGEEKPYFPLEKENKVTVKLLVEGVKECGWVSVSLSKVDAKPTIIPFSVSAPQCLGGDLSEPCGAGIQTYSPFEFQMFSRFNKRHLNMQRKLYASLTVDRSGSRILTISESCITPASQNVLTGIERSVNHEDFFFHSLVGKQSVNSPETSRTTDERNTPLDIKQYSRMPWMAVNFQFNLPKLTLTWRNRSQILLALHLSTIQVKLFSSTTHYCELCGGAKKMRKILKSVSQKTPFYTPHSASLANELYVSESQQQNVLLGRPSYYKKLNAETHSVSKTDLDRQLKVAPAPADAISHQRNSIPVSFSFNRMDSLDYIVPSFETEMLSDSQIYMEVTVEEFNLNHYLEADVPVILRSVSSDRRFRGSRNKHSFFNLNILKRVANPMYAPIFDDISVRKLCIRPPKWHMSCVISNAFQNLLQIQFSPLIANIDFSAVEQLLTLAEATMAEMPSVMNCQKDIWDTDTQLPEKPFSHTEFLQNLINPLYQDMGTLTGRFLVSFSLDALNKTDQLLMQEKPMTCVNPLGKCVDETIVRATSSQDSLMSCTIPNLINVKFLKERETLDSVDYEALQPLAYTLSCRQIVDMVRTSLCRYEKEWESPLLNLMHHMIHTSCPNDASGYDFEILNIFFLHQLTSWTVFLRDGLRKPMIEKIKTNKFKHKKSTTQQARKIFQRNISVIGVSSIFSHLFCLPVPEWAELKETRPFYIKALKIHAFLMTISIRTSSKAINRNVLHFVDALPLDTPYMRLQIGAEKRTCIVCTWRELVHSLRNSYFKQLIRQTLPFAWLFNPLAFPLGMWRGFLALLRTISEEAKINRAERKLGIEGAISGFRLGFVKFTLYTAGGFFQSLSHFANILHKAMGGSRAKPRFILDAFWKGMSGLFRDMFVTPWVALYEAPSTAHSRGENFYIITLIFLICFIRCCFFPLFGILHFITSVSEGLANVLIGDFEQYAGV